MKIVDKNTLLTMPKDTLFCRYTPYMNIFTEHNEYNSDSEPVRFHSVLHGEEPFLDISKGTTPYTERITKGCKIDINDFDEEQLFAVFSKAEMEALITALPDVLSDWFFIK